MPLWGFSGGSDDKESACNAWNPGSAGLGEGNDDLFQYSCLENSMDRGTWWVTVDKGLQSQGCGLSSSHILMWELNHKEDRAQKNWCFQTVVLKKTLENPLDSREIKSVNFKGKQPWILIGRTDHVAEVPVLWPSDGKSWLGKIPDVRKDWRQKEKRVTEDEMVGWHHWFNGHELGQTLGDDEGQGSLVCCSPSGHKEPDKTWQLNNHNNSKCHYCRGILSNIFALKIVF